MRSAALIFNPSVKFNTKKNVLLSIYDCNFIAEECLCKLSSYFFRNLTTEGALKSTAQLAVRAFRQCCL